MGEKLALVTGASSGIGFNLASNWQTEVMTLSLLLLGVD